MSVKFDSLAASLKRERKKHGLTQQDFADKFNVGLATVRNWEQGKTYPEAGTLERLCDFYECDMDYLFGRLTCKTHDVQFIHDYTGLDESTIEVLRDSLKPDGATMLVLNHLIKSDLLNKFTTYYASAFEKAAKKRPFSLIPFNHNNVSGKLSYADILEALPKDAATFFRTNQDDSATVKQMCFFLIWKSIGDGTRFLQLLYDNRAVAEKDCQLNVIAELLAYNQNSKDMAERLGLRLEDFIMEREETDDGTD